MFSGTVLEVAIGLVFVYLLLSLICSVINEWIAAFFERRPRNLRYGIEHRLSAVTREPGAAQGAAATSLTAAAFFSHPLIKTLAFGDKKTSYIPAERFALTILDLLAPSDGTGTKTFDRVRSAAAGLPDIHPFKKVILTAIDQAGGDLARLQAGLQDRYNECMDRLTGVYKRWNMLILAILAALVAATLNADTLMIIRVLTQDRAVRQSAVSAAEAYIKTHPAAPAKKAPAVDASGSGTKEQSLQDQIRDVRRPLEELGLPLQWRWEEAEGADGDPSRTPWGDGSHTGWWFWKAVGLVVTTAALSLGAPFWFDVLNRFINFRSTIKTDDDTDNKAVRRKTKPPASVTGTGGTGNP